MMPGQEESTNEYEVRLGRLASLTSKPTHYCSGCEHGILTKLIANAIDELELRERCVLIDSVGCSVFAHEYINVDAISAAHGRAPAVMAGIKRVRPDLVTFAVQGDGDAAAIGLQELIYAAVRGEPITIFMVNNAIYGMTGGQMAPTTPEGMVTTTTPEGRDTAYTGTPVDASKLLGSLDGPSYVKRVFLPIAPLKSRDLYSAAGPLEGARSVVNAFKVQLAGGFAFVEFVSTCSINWKMSVLDSKKYAYDVLSKIFPPGLYKDKLGVERR